MRAFLALDLTEPQLIKNLSDIQREIMATGADVKLVEPENLHFTLRFFGEIPEIMAEQIYTSIADVKTSPIEVRLEGLGSFPSLSRISVIWVGTDYKASAILMNLASSVEARLKQFTFEDEKGFSPHVTIARVRSGRNKERLQELIRRYAGYEFGKDLIASIKLKKSQLTPQGPIYSDVYVLPLRGDQ